MENYLIHIDLSNILAEEDFFFIEKKILENPNAKIVVLHSNYLIFNNNLIWIFKKLRKYNIHIAVTVADLHHDKNEDIFNLKFSRDILSSWDVDSFIVLFNRDKIPFLKEKLNNVFWLVASRYWGENLIELPSWDKKLSIGYFLGFGEEKRANIINHLFCQDIPLVWERTKKRLNSTIEMYSRYKFCLNICRDKDFNYRNSEIFEAGSLLIADSSQDGINEILTPFEHYVPWENEMDLVEKIKYYIEHQDKAQEIAIAGSDYWKYNFSNIKLFEYIQNYILFNKPLPKFMEI